MSSIWFPFPQPLEQQVLNDGTRQVSYATLWQRVARGAEQLRQAGLNPGDRIALWGENRCDYVEALLAGICAGCWVVPLNWHLTETEVAYVLADSGCRLLLTGDRSGHPVTVPTQPMVELLTGTPSCYPQPQDPAGGVMLYTSGTTGKPKGVKRWQPERLGALFELWQWIGQGVGLSGGAHLITGPLYHAAPLFYALYDLANGGSLHVMPRFDAELALQWIERESIGHTHWVPTMFVRALRLPPSVQQRYRLDSLNLVLHGAAPIGVTLKQQMIDWWGPCLVEYWGGSEGGIVTRVDSRQWLNNPGTVGTPLPHMEVFAVDEQGERLPAGELGQLYIRHRQQAQPFIYHQSPEKTAAAYREPGVYTLGDVGWIDELGQVFLADRQSHVILSGGVNIYPAEVEQVLLTHPAVLDVAVFGLADDEWGQQVVAAVVADPALAQEELDLTLTQLCQQQLASYKHPRRFDRVDSLPRADSGKLYLRQLLAQHYGVQ